MQKRMFLHLALLFLFCDTSSFSIENKILLKIENQIITTLDVNNEFKYLIALNPNIKNSKREDILRLSKRSIIQEKIKKIEIENNLKLFILLTTLFLNNFYQINSQHTVKNVFLNQGYYYFHKCNHHTKYEGQQCLTAEHGYNFCK